MLRQIVLCSVLSLAVRGQHLDTAKMADLVDQAHAAGTFDGVVVVAQDGKVILTKALGEADRVTKISNAPDTVFRLASMTKPSDFAAGDARGRGGAHRARSLVERQGDIECTLLLNLLLPSRNASIVILANTERADLFNT